MYGCYWGFIDVKTNEVLLPSDKEEHHTQLANILGHDTKESACVKSNLIAFDIPCGYEVRADFILGDTKNHAARQALRKFILYHHLKYNISYVDITGYRGKMLKSDLVEDAIDEL